ncbi:Trem-like transcript 2 protein, partial [Frankliniella fusca]
NIFLRWPKKLFICSFVSRRLGLAVQVRHALLRTASAARRRRPLCCSPTGYTLASTSTSSASTSASTSSASTSASTSSASSSSASSSSASSSSASTSSASTSSASTSACT